MPEQEINEKSNKSVARYRSDMIGERGGSGVLVKIF